MDPRSTAPHQRVSNHSPLMAALCRRQTGEVVNFCPYGCRDEDLDEVGHCGHLIGFYNGGQTFEPRVLRKKDNRIIVHGESRQPMKRGYKLVKITTSARVYSHERNEDLTPKRNSHVKSVADTIESERALREFAERIRNPVLEGEWDDSVYDPLPKKQAAPTAADKK